MFVHTKYYIYFFFIKQIHMTENERIGKRIAEIRKENGISQVRLAKETGMHQSVISRIESGKHAISINVLNRIAKALDVKIELI